jgi:cytochrome d ubiquinol oxidase subunit II
VVPVVSAIFSGWFVIAVSTKRELLPFLLTLGLFVMSFAGLAASLYPNLTPPAISFREAANADKSLSFMLVGALVLLPVIATYTAHNYWVFRGKIRSDAGYH